MSPVTDRVRAALFSCFPFSERSTRKFKQPRQRRGWRRHSKSESAIFQAYIHLVQILNFFQELNRFLKFTFFLVCDTPARAAAKETNVFHETWDKEAACRSRPTTAQKCTKKRDARVFVALAAVALLYPSWSWSGSWSCSDMEKLDQIYP